MPLYAYRCKDCGHEFEARQRMSEDPLEECPACAGTVRRVINQVGVVFKGSGFYVTDSKSNNPASASKPGSESTSSGGDTAAPAADAPKSEATTTAKETSKETAST